MDITRDEDIAAKRGAEHFAPISLLETIRQGGRTWEALAPACGVTHPDPPWKTSLLATCESLAANDILPTPERRSAEDDLSATIYDDLPAPESQLMSLAHLMMARQLIDEDHLAAKLEAVKARLTAGA